MKYNKFKHRVMKCLELAILVMNMTNKATKNPLRSVSICAITPHLRLLLENKWTSMISSDLNSNDNSKAPKWPSRDTVLLDTIET